MADEKKKNAIASGESSYITKVQSVEEGTIQVDAVFGEISNEGPNYRNVGWLGTAVLMLKTQVGLGVLSIPSVFNVLGLIPGIICLLIISAITTWSGYYVGVFKKLHADVYGIDDVGQLIFGRIGREFFGFAFALYWICSAGGGMLTISIALNAVSSHGTCTAVFVAVACLVAFCLASIQTLSRISWLAWAGIISIVVSVFILMIGVGVEARPPGAPHNVPWRSDFKLFNNPGFAEAAGSIATLTFAFVGTPAYFSIVSEMRDPRLYTRSLLLCQSFLTVLYLIVGIVVVVYCGSFVASPALGSAGILIKRICYGIALPGLCASTTLLTHYPAKFIFVRVLRNSKHLSRNTPIHYIVWFSCTFGSAVIAYIIASGIPVFNGLLGLVGALLGTIMSFQPMGMMWLYDNWSLQKELRSRTWNVMAGWAIFVIVSGTFLMVAGTYGSVVDIINTKSRTAAWSCADNSN